MSKSTKSYEERLLEMERREQESLEKAKKYAAQKRELQKRQKAEESKKRTHRLCVIGGAVESVLGCPIEEEDIPNLIGFLKRQEANGRYTSLMMCENAPPEWMNVPDENIKRFQKSIRYQRAEDKEAALEKFKIVFRKQRLWNEVLKVEKCANAQLGRSFEFSLPKEWSRMEQIEYTTDFIQRNFVAKGMCADWSIHDKGDDKWILYGDVT